MSPMRPSGSANAGELRAANEVPAALQTTAKKLKPQMSFLKLGFRVVGGRPYSAVKSINMASTVVALRNVTGKFGVRNRMVFDFHGEPFYCWIEAWTLRTRPAFQRVTDLQTEVVVPPARMVKLHNENWARSLFCRPFCFRLGSVIELPLPFI